MEHDKGCIGRARLTATLDADRLGRVGNAIASPRRLQMNLCDSFRIRFSDRYNPTRSVEEAIRKSLNAPVQHYLLYSRQAALIESERAKVRTYWRDCLCEISKEFRADVSLKSYESMVEALKCNIKANLAIRLKTIVHTDECSEYRTPRKIFLSLLNIFGVSVKSLSPKFAQLTE